MIVQDYGACSVKIIHIVQLDCAGDVHVHTVYMYVTCCIVCCRFSSQSAMMSVAFREGVKIPPSALNDVILGAGHDVRQVRHSSLAAASQLPTSSATTPKVRLLL